MPFIAFLGCDGAGKSAVINGISKIYEVEGQQVHNGHWCPRPLRSSSSTSATEHASDPHRLKPKGEYASYAQLFWIWMNWWSGWFLELRAISKAGFLIYDRFHADLLVDPVRYRYGGNMKVASIFSGLMPRPDLVIYLDAPSDVLLSRKQEVSAAELEKSRQGYLKLCADHAGQYTVIDASQPLNEVIHQVRAVVSQID